MVEKETIDLAQVRDQRSCQVYWGSHGCDLPIDKPHTVHQCGHEPTQDELRAVEEGDLAEETLGVCSYLDESTSSVRYVRSDGTLSKPFAQTYWKEES